MDTVHLLVKLSEAEAFALAEFLERIRYDDYLKTAAGREQAYTMLEAGAKVYCVLKKIERVRKRTEKMTMLAAMYDKSEVATALLKDV